MSTSTLESLRRTIHSAESLYTIVKTMKALAMVSIRQYERAVAALSDYTRTIEMGLQVVLRNQPELTAAATPATPASRSATRLGAVVFGSDYGMVGQFNEHIASYALDDLHRLQVTGAKEHGAPQPVTVTVLPPVAIAIAIAVGERVAGRLDDAGMAVNRTLAVPSSVGGITPLVQDLLVTIEAWRMQHGLNRLLLFYNRPRGGASYQPAQQLLLPVDAGWLHEIQTRPWPSNRLPTSTVGTIDPTGPDWEVLFSRLIRQHLFVSLYRACAESLASEQASRLASMQGAQKNIEERLDELTGLFHQQRQSAITEELLDIVAGVEAIGI
ncbi:MAG: F0F1 ATP synthase subunit gamma [Chloroflexaceae bacterium]|nr:F0F1 ATP synthase subunit gamma [Chloroflexaceae bacterium]